MFCSSRKLYFLKWKHGIYKHMYEIFTDVLLNLMRLIPTGAIIHRPLPLIGLHNFTNSRFSRLWNEYGIYATAPYFNLFDVVCHLFRYCCCIILWFHSSPLHFQQSLRGVKNMDETSESSWRSPIKIVQSVILLIYTADNIWLTMS